MTEGEKEGGREGYKEGRTNRVKDGWRGGRDGEK